jgi:hypothetical protein
MNNQISIGFAHDLVPLIINGSKTLTYRIGNKYDFLKIGDKIAVRDSSENRIFGNVEINEKSYISFSDLPIDRIGHEVYSSKQEQKETFEKYYGEFAEDENILVLGFRLLDIY